MLHVLWGACGDALLSMHDTCLLFNVPLQEAHQQFQMWVSWLTR